MLPLYWCCLKVGKATETYSTREQQEIVLLGCHEDVDDLFGDIYVSTSAVVNVIKTWK